MEAQCPHLEVDGQILVLPEIAPLNVCVPVPVPPIVVLPVRVIGLLNVMLLPLITNAHFRSPVPANDNVLVIAECG